MSMTWRIKFDTLSNKRWLVFIRYYITLFDPKRFHYVFEDLSWGKIAKNKWKSLKIIFMIIKPYVSITSGGGAPAGGLGIKVRFIRVNKKKIYSKDARKNIKPA